MSCLGGLGSGGISAFTVKCPKDAFNDDEKIKIQAKIDNLRSSTKISNVSVKLLRHIRLHTGGHQPSSSYDTLLTQVLSKHLYDGQAPRTRDTQYSREYTLDLE